MKNSKTISTFMLSVLSFLPSFVSAQFTPSLVDFDAYEKLVIEVKEHRKTRLVNADEFLAISKEEHVIILDTRSDSMYAAVHVKGAIHLNFSDFTQANLARIIPSNDYKILIYCNNNFISEPNTLQANVNIINPDFSKFFVTKMAWPMDRNPALPKQKGKEKSKQTTSNSSVSNQFLAELSITDKPLTLALNIPTYINLYGYGYRHVYELSELVNTYMGKLEFEGTAVRLK